MSHTCTSFDRGETCSVQVVSLTQQTSPVGINCLTRTHLLLQVCGVTSQPTITSHWIDVLLLYIQNLPIYIPVVHKRIDVGCENIANFDPQEAVMYTASDVVCEPRTHFLRHCDQIPIIRMLARSGKRVWFEFESTCLK